MVKCYQLVRGKKATPMDNKCYKSKSQATREKNLANKQFKEFNKLIKEKKIDRKPIKLVRVQQINFSRKQNVFG